MTCMSVNDNNNISGNPDSAGTPGEQNSSIQKDAEKPVPTPPPIIKPTIQKPQKKSNAWKWILTIIFGLFIVGAGVILNSCVSILSITEPTISSEPKFIESVIEDNGARDKILVIDVSGIIVDGPIDGIGMSIGQILKKQFKRAASDKGVKAVLLRIDSPGGEVITADEIYKAIEDFQKNSKKPVVASMGSMAASGGYYIAAPCRWIVANELTITGSIGVILSTWNYRGLMNKVGLRPEVFKSGKFKDMLSGQRDLESMTPEQRKIYEEEREMVQKLIDETYSHFKSVVKKGRSDAEQLNFGMGRQLVTNWTDFADGRILSGNQAYELGFVDELGNFDVAVKRAKLLSGISGDANLVQYQIPISFANLLRFFGKGDAKNIKVDIGIEPPKIQAGKLYFISPSTIY